MACTARLVARAEVDAELGSVDLPALEQPGVLGGPRGDGQRDRRLLAVASPIGSRPGRQLGLTPARTEDMSAFAHELLRRGQADAAASARDEGGFSFQRTHVYPLCCQLEAFEPPYTRTMSLPKLRPSNMPMKASGAFSSPSTKSSRYRMRPSAMPAPTSRRKAG